MSDTTDGPGDEPIDTPPGATDDEITLLASAYLDGDATEAERARVESSDELLGEVESLRQVRAVLGATTEPPPISVRESHLAAALGVWDRMSELERSGDVTPGRGVDAAAAAAITTPAPASSGPRRDRRPAGNTPRWLLGAAAGFIVLAGTGLVVRSVIDSDDDRDDIALDAPSDDATDERVTEPDLLAAEAELAFDGVEGEPELPEVDESDVFSEDERPENESAATETEEEAPAEEPAEVLADEAADDASAAAESTAAASEDAASADESDVADGGEFDPFPPELELDRLVGVDDLRDFAAFAAYPLVESDASATTPDPPYETCDDELGPAITLEQYAGPALYVPDPATGDGIEVQVIVAIDDDEPPDVVAYRPENCEIVEQAPLPTREEFEAGRTGS